MSILIFFSFFFNATATTEIYTLSLHDALPICAGDHPDGGPAGGDRRRALRLQPGLEHRGGAPDRQRRGRSEEHTSELQSRRDLVCRLLLEKKKKKKNTKQYMNKHTQSDGDINI